MISDPRIRLAEIDPATYAKAEHNLEYFYRKAWRILEPQTDLMVNWHQGAMAEHLTAAYQRQIKRLIINVPPRYSKSNAVSVAFPAWSWTQAPHLRFMCFSYAGSLAVKHSVDRRTVIESPWYQRGWGHRFQLAGDQNLKTEFQNDKRGHMIASSLVGSATGKGGDFLIVDDPHDPSRAGSQKKRDTDVLEFDRKIRSRLDDKLNGVIIIVMQRLHVKDLTGHVLEAEGRVEDGGEWTVLDLPALVEKTCYVSLPVTKRRIKREPGEPLHPAREDMATLEKVKKGMTPHVFNAQYNQRPTQREGGILKRKYWQRYNFPPPDLKDHHITVDCSFEDTASSDNVSIQVWARTGPDRYALDMLKEKLGFTSTIQAILAMRKKWPQARKLLIEKKANGHGIIQILKRKIVGVVECKPIGSKAERAAACEPALMGSNVWLPANASWVDDFIEECAAFGPGSDVDDQVDAFTQSSLFYDSSEGKGDYISKLLRF